MDLLAELKNLFDNLPDAVKGAILVGAWEAIRYSFRKCWEVIGPRFREWWATLSEGQKKGLVYVAVGTLLILSVALSWNWVLATVKDLVNPPPPRSYVEELINHCWIAYDPIHFDPHTNPSPNLNEIDQELTWIKDAGFNGIITFNSRGSFSEIPRLAKQEKLSVIMGVWDPTDTKELDAAISKSNYVDMYSIGHDGLWYPLYSMPFQNYSYGDLDKAMRYVRSRVQKPISTSERPAMYEHEKRIIELGDWIFPDSHVNFLDPRFEYSGDVLRDAGEAIENAKTVANLKERKEKPILLKMVTYPWSGIPNVSLQKQSDFFANLSIRLSGIYIPKVTFSFQSAFDVPWKKEPPFGPWEQYTGLLDDDGKPRPAVQVIMDRFCKRSPP